MSDGGRGESVREWVEVPEPWEPIEYLCEPRRGSKAYKHPSGANVHIIEMAPGTYIAQKENESGEFEEVKWIPYREAVRTVNRWMASQSVDTETDSPGGDDQ